MSYDGISTTSSLLLLLLPLVCEICVEPSNYRAVSDFLKEDPVHSTLGTPSSPFLTAVQIAFIESSSLLFRLMASPY